MTIIKICGLMEREHIETAVQAGVNWIGFVFAPSKRQVTIEQAKVLAEAVPAHVKKVGVFVNAEPDFIQQAAQEVGLDYIQYHGDETNEVIQAIGLPSVKAFAIRSEEDLKEAAKYKVDYYLFDAPGTDYRGGSGHTFDWSHLKAWKGAPFLLAGGLNIENVANAITAVQPFGIDVSSGVERDGRKDHELIEQFISKARGAEQHASND